MLNQKSLPGDVLAGYFTKRMGLKLKGALSKTM